MYCDECGAKFKKTEEACPECGKKVSDMDIEKTKKKNVDVTEEKIELNAVDNEVAVEEEKIEGEIEATEDENLLDESDISALTNEDAEIKPSKKGNIGLIISIVAVLLVLVLGAYFIFFGKGFNFGKVNLDGTWDADGYYFVFDGENAKQYYNNEVAQEYEVKYVSKNEIILSYYDESYKCTAEIGLKPVITTVDGEKQLELFTLYQNTKYDEIGEDTEATLSMSKIDKMPDPVSTEFENNMSDDMKKQFYATWKGKTTGSDGTETNLEMTFKENSVNYVVNSEANDYEVFYVSDDEVVIHIYYEEYNVDYYMSYEPSFDGDKLTLTPKYTISEGQKVEATEQDTATVLTKQK